MSVHDVADALFSPVVIGRHTLRNRLALAPMTTQQSEVDGAPSAADARWLGGFVDDGYGLVFTCAASIGPLSTAFQRQLSFGSDAHVRALTSLARGLVGRGAVVVAQLVHGGGRALPALTGAPNVSASAYAQPLPGWVPPRGMTVDEIGAVVDDFAAAAARAQRAGFDGVEVHAANGYLLTQFLSTESNRRADGYGVDVAGRARFVREVVRAVRARVGPDFLVGVRVSAERAGHLGGLDIDDTVQTLCWLVDDGIDYAHLSLWQRDTASVKHPGRTVLGHVAAGLPAGLPLIAAGGVGSRADADAVLKDGAAVVAVGRAAIGNAGIPQKFASFTPLVPQPFPRAALQGRLDERFLAYLTGPMAARSIVGD